MSLRARKTSACASLVAAMVAAALWTAMLPALLPAQDPATRAGAGSDAAARLRSADAAYAAGDAARAEREYAAILALDSAQSRAVFRLAQLRQRLHPRAAVALYRRYVALEPRDPWGFIALGDALAATGSVREGLAAYDAAARLDPHERDVQVGRARLLARAGHTDAAVRAYERYLATAPRDAEAWGELALQHRRAGRPDRAVTALGRRRDVETGAASRTAVDRDIARVRATMRATADPFVAGSRDSDGLTTTRGGVSMTGSLAGGARVTGTVSAGQASDPLVARGTQDATARLEYRPAAQLRLELAGGVQRADRTQIETTAATGPTKGPRLPAGSAPAAGTSSHDALPVGRARLAWRQPGDDLAVDARLGRQLIDASPWLVAQGVLRDEAALALDYRLRGPVRARAFGRLASIHNEVERNRRHVLGGALAWVPGRYEVTLRGQTMAYAQATTLAYFAPREVRSAELTAYTERETAGGTTLALDLGAGGQQVTDWTTGAGRWAPAFRGWAQVLVPLDAARSLGAELEAYDSTISMDTPTAPDAGSRWRYGSARLWLRIAF